MAAPLPSSRWRFASGSLSAAAKLGPSPLPASPASSLPASSSLARFPAHAAEVPSSTGAPPWAGAAQGAWAGLACCEADGGGVSRTLEKMSAERRQRASGSLQAGERTKSSSCCRRGLGRRCAAAASMSGDSSSRRGKDAGAISLQHHTKPCHCSVWLHSLFTISRSSWRMKDPSSEQERDMFITVHMNSLGSGVICLRFCSVIARLSLVKSARLPRQVWMAAFTWSSVGPGPVGGVASTLWIATSSSAGVRHGPLAPGSFCSMRLSAAWKGASERVMSCGRSWRMPSFGIPASTAAAKRMSRWSS
mmetsp:Transcript_27003/g.76121  ORF Transcript_27003/g.76121 Transcript_27003/m.76121 type:complete len:306 (-) Transcript_27003:858-1775(-)